MPHRIGTSRPLRGLAASAACLIALGWATAAAPAPATVPSTGLVAVAARLERNGAAPRLTFDLSHTVDAQAFVLENPDRVVIEAPQINFQIDPVAGQVHIPGLVQAFRFGRYTAERSRIVIDLSGPASVQKVEATAIEGHDAAHLTIQLARTDRASFHQAALQGASALARTQTGPADPAPSGPQVADGDKPVVVIDPGHGGVDPGATGLGGVVEKDLTFRFAEALASKLNARGRYSVRLTRTDDSFVSLPDRVKVTRDAKAALFVSIHADTVAEGDSVSGATVYTASDRASDAEAARLAAKENKVDQEAGLEPAPDASEVSDILFDLTRRETRTFSHAFQRTLSGYWQKVSHLNKNPERAAGFWVLKAPDVPSVLLELGYLSSSRDVAALTAPAWRDKAAGAVAASIDSFFDQRGRESQAAVAQAGAATGSDPDKTAIVVLRPHL